MTTRRTTVRRQPAIRGVTRRPQSSAFTPALNRAVESEMRRYKCSRAFVLATCASFALNVDDQPDYRKDDIGRKPMRRRRR